jgi:hypothetical protein
MNEEMRTDGWERCVLVGGLFVSLLIVGLALDWLLGRWVHPHGPPFVLGVASLACSVMANRGTLKEFPVLSGLEPL